MVLSDILEIDQLQPPPTRLYALIHDFIYELSLLDYQVGYQSLHNFFYMKTGFKLHYYSYIENDKKYFQLNTLQNV